MRDNVYVALAHETSGRFDVAVRAAAAIADFYRKYRFRFLNIIEGRCDPSLAMNRPHTRFDGGALSENPEPWAHAQNDALGYFLWLYCRLARSGRLKPDFGLLTLFASFFERISYWQDEDSGHWEEARKLEASSVGAVVAGLRELSALATGGDADAPSPDRLEALIDKGMGALQALLPFESRGPGPKKARRYDAALMFLIYPLEVVDDAMARRIVEDVRANLLGEYGIRRYLGDSYWTADYKRKFSPADLTSDASGRQAARDALARPGEEAQWCLFDPILSIIAGRTYARTGNPAARREQVHYLNRALGQITGPDCPLGAMRCPEAYYLENGRYVASDQTPLLWTQANLRNALLTLEGSLAGRGDGVSSARDRSP